MTTPADLKYAKTHEWVKQEPDGTLLVGITDHAQEMLGDIVFVELPAAGRKLLQGESCAVVESVKTASDIHAPVTGEVVATNPAVTDAPEKINQDAYAAWLYRLKPDNSADLASLLDALAYQQIADAEKS